MGFPQIPERAPKSVQNRTFCTLSVQEGRFCKLLGALSGIFLGSAKARLLPHMNVLVVWALWPEVRPQTEIHKVYKIFLFSDMFKVFTEDCFLLRGFWMSWPLAAYSQPSMCQPFGMLMVVVTPAHVTSSVCWLRLSKEDADASISWWTLKSETDTGLRPLQVIQCFIQASAHNSYGCEFPPMRERERATQKSRKRKRQIASHADRPSTCGFAQESMCNRERERERDRESDAQHERCVQQRAGNHWRRGYSVRLIFRATGWLQL